MSEHERERAADRGDLTAEAWREALRDGTLLGQRCRSCEHATAAPKAACARCGSRDLMTVELPTEGEVYAETTVAVPPKGLEGPYQVAVIEVGDARVMARVEGDAEIGDAVELEGIVEAGDRPGPLFR